MVRSFTTVLLFAAALTAAWVYALAGGVLYAVDAATGTERWRFTAEEPIWSSPAVVDDTLYVGSIDGFFYALDIATGAKVWQVDSQGMIWSSSPAISISATCIATSSSGRYPARKAATHALVLRNLMRQCGLAEPAGALQRRGQRHGFTVAGQQRIPDLAHQLRALHKASR